MDEEDKSGCGHEDDLNYSEVGFPNDIICHCDTDICNASSKVGYNMLAGVLMLFILRLSTNAQHHVFFHSFVCFNMRWYEIVWLVIWYNVFKVW